MKKFFKTKKIGRDVKRYFNIIKRAVSEFDFQVDPSDPLDEIANEAEILIIMSKTKYEDISVCGFSHNRGYDQHVSWSDGMGYNYESDGQIIEDYDTIPWYHYDEETGTYNEIPASEADREHDYYFVADVVDTIGEVVRLISND